MSVAGLQQERTNTFRGALSEKRAGTDGKSANPATSSLPDDLRTQFESSYNTDLSNVTINRNSQRASSMGAEAFAQGNQIDFAPAQFKPETQDGRRLIGHELAHVVQQRRGQVQPMFTSKGVSYNQSESLESQADQMADRAISSPFSPQSSSHTAPAQLKPVVQMKWGRKKKKPLPQIGNLQKLGGTASDVYRGTSDETLGTSGSKVGYVKKALKGIDPNSLDEPLKSAFNKAKNQEYIDDNEKQLLRDYLVQNMGGSNIGGATTDNVDIGNIPLSYLLPDDHSWDMGQHGINPLQAPNLLTEDPRLLGRSVMSSRLDKALGTNVLSEEMFGQSNGQLVGISAEVGGEALNEKDDDTGKSVRTKHDWKSANVQRGMSNLTLMDALTGQMDRHGGNIKIDESGTVKGIDNDMAFGTSDRGAFLKGITNDLFTQQKDKSGEVKKDKKGRALLNYNQKHIDEKTGKAILKMSKRKFKKMIKGDPNDPQRLSQKEVDAAVQRFNAIKAQVKSLKKSGGLIKDWNDDTYNEQMADKDKYDDYSGYLGRSVTAFNDAGKWGDDKAKMWQGPKPPPAAPKSASAAPRMGRKMKFEKSAWAKRQRANKAFRSKGVKPPPPPDQKQQDMDQVLKEMFPFY